MDKIQILMSTYNGEKYLIEQLDSIKNQDYQNISILIRDDGSKDNTIAIIEKYISDNPGMEIELIKGENTGVLASFIKLVELSDIDAQYYAFADQDDVWFKDKISRAVKKLNENKKALIYASTFLPVDKNLNIIKYKQSKKIPSFYNALVENIATGCTIVFNKKMKDHVIGKEINGASIHDWWFYIVATALGEMIYDPEPSLYYRQHDSNSIGSKDSSFKKWKSRVIRYSKWRTEIFRHGYLLLDHYSNILEKDKTTDLTEFLGYKKMWLFKRFKYISCMKIYRQSKLDDFILKILLLLKLIY